MYRPTSDSSESWATAVGEVRGLAGRWGLSGGTPFGDRLDWLPVGSGVGLGSSCCSILELIFFCCCVIFGAKPANTALSLSIN